MSKIDNPGGIVFWGEIAPCEHLVQFYEDDKFFFDALSSFVADGLRGNESVIVLLTKEHRVILENSLRSVGIDLEAATKAGRYICRDADEMLSKFIVNDWPDKERFEHEIKQLLAIARTEGRQVRAFGELVAILWAQGLNGATVNLEHLWHSLCTSEKFSLFCAYPKSGITRLSSESFNEICDAHTRLVGSKSIFDADKSSDPQTYLAG